MKVVEIFNSIDGEGKRTGLPTTFIRLFGCNLACSYCDSQYACVETKTITPQYKIMSVEEILTRVRFLGCTNITLTGGEPLIHAGVEQLIDALIDEGCWVNVETNGTCVPKIQTEDGQLFYTMDYKTNASGMTQFMNDDAIKALRYEDCLKFVVDSVGDLEQALELVERLNPKAQIYVSPVWGKIEGAQIVEFLKKHKLWYWKAQVQLHKIWWDPDKRGV